MCFSRNGTGTPLVDCDCGGQGIVEYSTDEMEKIAICLRCDEDIPKDECWYGCETGFDFRVALVDQDDNGNHVHHTVCMKCYNRFHNPYS